MKLIEVFAGQPLVECIGWALLHFLWQGVLIAVLLKGLLHALRRDTAALRYGMACAALLLMSLCPVVTTALLWRQSQTSDGITIQVPQSIPAAKPAKAAASFTPASPTPDLKPAAAPRPSLSLPRLLPWLVALWLAGVLLLSFRMLGAWGVVRRLITQNTWPAPETAIASLRALAARMKILKLPRLLESARVQTPVAIGGLRAVILLPAGMVTGLSTPMLEALLVHELAHLQRHDYLVNLWQMAMETILFYHPALWWVSQQIRIEREHCCDDRVEAMLQDRLTYARALMSLEETRPRTLALAASDGELLARIRRILSGEATMATKGSPAVVVLAIALTLLVCVPVVYAAGTAQAALGGQASTAPKHVWMRGVHIRMNEQGTPLDAALAKVFQQTPFDYIYTDNDNPLNKEDFACSFMLDDALSLMKRIANPIVWGVNRNIVFAQQDAGKDDATAARKYSARIRMTPLADALEALQAVHPFRYRVEDKANPRVVEATFSKLNFNEALAQILAHCETPMKFTRSGDVLIVTPDASLPRPSIVGVEPAPIIEAGNPPPPAPGKFRFSIYGSFESAIDAVFRTVHKPYRIAPSVIETEDRITFDRQDITLEEALSALLPMAPGQDKPLTYRIENGIYIIESKESGTKSGEIVFTTPPGDNTARGDYSIDNLSIADALRTIAEKSKQDYLLCLLPAEKRVTLKLKNATVEQALRAAVRAGDLEPRLKVFRDPGDLIRVAPDLHFAPRTAQAALRYTGRCTETSAWNLFGSAGELIGNYKLDAEIKNCHVTVTFQDRTLDQMLADIQGVASPRISIDFTGGILFVKSK